MAVDKTYINLRNWTPVTANTANSGVYTISFSATAPEVWPEAAPARFAATLEFHWCYTCTANSEYSQSGIVHCSLSRHGSGDVYAFSRIASDLTPGGRIASLGVSVLGDNFRLVATMASSEAAGFLTVVPMLHFVQVAS